MNRQTKPRIKTPQIKVLRPRDENRVDVNDESEVKYWTRYFRVTREQLLAAVRRRGDRFDDVKRSLGRYS